MLTAKIDAMQKAFDKMSVKAVANHQPKPCSFCGDATHVYVRCPLAQRDEDYEQVNSLNSEPSHFPRPPFSRTYSKDSIEQQNWKWNQVNPSSSINCNFHNNREPQPAPPKPYNSSAVDNFMLKQSKMNQMMFEQRQALNAQLVDLAAHNKMIENQLSQQAPTTPQPRGKLPGQPEPNLRAEVKAITLRSGTDYNNPAMPARPVSVHTDGAA